MNEELHVIQTKCELIIELFNTSATYVDPSSNIHFKLSKYPLNPLYETEKDINILNFDSEIHYHTPIIRKTNYFEKFLIISVVKNDTFEGNVIIGPFLTSTISKENLNGLINDHHAFFRKNEIFQYYSSIPTFTIEKLLNLSVLLHYLLNDQLISQEDLLEFNKDINKGHKEPEPFSLEEPLAPVIPTFRNRLFEKEILSIVKEGRVEALGNPIFLKDEGSAAFFSDIGYLRSLKTHIITLITLVTRSAIDGGVNTEEAFQLNDHFILKLEKINTVSEAKKMTKDMLYTFTNAVKDVTQVSYSKTINKCVDYVIRNLHANLSHDEIASHVNLSPKYLSVLFKKEVGIPLTDYIRLKRVEEAKRLLEYTQTTIPEICAHLNFYDQSYFTKVFKNIVGVTPRYYRENNKVNK